VTSGSTLQTAPDLPDSVPGAFCRMAFREAMSVQRTVGEVARLARVSVRTLSDPRFTKNIDKAREGLAAYQRAAMRSYANAGRRD